MLRGRCEGIICGNGGNLLADTETRKWVTRGLRTRVIMHLAQAVGVPIQETFKDTIHRSRVSGIATGKLGELVRVRKRRK